jgi:type I restriction enzyme S subunit
MKSHSNQWDYRKLEEVCEQITDGKHGDCENQPDSGFYFLSCKDVFDGALHYEDARQITEADFIEAHRRTKFAPFDILITNSGTIGRMALVPDSELTRRTTFQKSVALLKPARAQVNPAFLYYALQADIRRLIEFAGGTAQKNLLLRDLRAFRIQVPPVRLQDRIASILSAYDDLIQNSRRRIRVLEEMAHVLYREWFVHFRFPGHENLPCVASPIGDIPKGWEVGRLDDLLVLQRGFDLPKLERAEGTVPIYAATGVTGFHNEAKVKAPGVVTGRSGTIGDVLYVQEDFWPLNTTLWVKQFPKAEPLYAYYVLSTIDLKQFNSGAAVPTLNRNDIHKLDALIPPRDIQKRFQELAGTMFAQMRTLSLQVKTLTRARDLLLPRLLSGQINIEANSSEAERIAESASALEHREPAIV